MLTVLRSPLFSKAQLDQILQGQTGDTREFAWECPAFSKKLPVSIELAEPGAGVRQKTVEILNDLAQLGPTQRQKIRHLLFEDAKLYREVAEFGDPDAQKFPLKRSFWEWISGAAPAFQFIAIDRDDPGHPCKFEAGEDGVDEKVTYERFELIEDDGCEQRLCYLHCYPEWEAEHGRRIVIRNGEPIALSDPPELLEAYDSI